MVVQKELRGMPQCQGGFQFMTPAEEVMELYLVCHQTEDQVSFTGIVERLCLGWMTEQDEEYLRVLTLDAGHYT
jgi:hypothetical protein